MNSGHRQALPEGYRLQNFHIIRVLGQGGFGITYLAYDEALNQDVAIKEFFPATLAVRETSTQTVEFATLDGKELFEWGLKRFLEEARIMARLDNPHIVRVFQYLQLNNTGYMVMQFEKGRTLADWAMAFPEGRLPQAELLRILDPITSALDQVHQLQIAHRDLKPENILIRADGSPVIIDFGAARSTVAGKSHTVAALVTPGYSPIEQYSIAAEQGPWSDIYALGAVCYELIAGRKPAEATSRINSLQSDQFSDPCRPLLEERPHGYDTYVLRAVDQAMAIVASDRPQSVASWRAELRFGNHGDDQRRVKTPIAAPRRTTSDVGAAGKWRLAGLGLAVLAIAVAVGFSTYQLLAPDDGGSLDDRLRATFNIPRTVGSISSQPAPIKQPTTPRNEAKQDGAIEVKLEMELQKAREEREKLEQLREQAEAERQQREAEEERRRAAERERQQQLAREREMEEQRRQRAEAERRQREEAAARQRAEEERRRRRYAFIDSATGVAVDLPSWLTAQSTEKSYGTNYSKGKNGIEVDTLKYENVDCLRNRMTKMRDGKAETPDYFSVSGNEGELSGEARTHWYWVKMVQKGDECRGLSIVVSKRARKYRKLMDELMDSFVPFPN